MSGQGMKNLPRIRRAFLPSDTRSGPWFLIGIFHGCKISDAAIELAVANSVAAYSAETNGVAADGTAVDGAAADGAAAVGTATDGAAGDDAVEPPTTGV